MGINTARSAGALISPLVVSFNALIEKFSARNRFRVVNVEQYLGDDQRGDEEKLTHRDFPLCRIWERR